MRSLVASALRGHATPPQYTTEEQRNLELILTLRSVPFDERRRFMHPRLRYHRAGMAGLAELSGHLDGTGYTADSVSDRIDAIEDIVAKDDRVWAVWTLRGRHTGELFGIPATGRTIEIVEMGIWRIEDGLVIESWFFADEFQLLRQLGFEITTKPGNDGAGPSPTLRPVTAPHRSRAASD